MGVIFTVSTEKKGLWLTIDSIIVSWVPMVPGSKTKTRRKQYENIHASFGESQVSLDFTLLSHPDRPVITLG